METTPATVAGVLRLVAERDAARLAYEALSDKGVRLLALWEADPPAGASTAFREAMAAFSAELTGPPAPAEEGDA